MILNKISYLPISFFGNEKLKNVKNKTKLEPPETQKELYSKGVSCAIKAQNLYKLEFIPEIGEVPKSIIEKCSTGEKGQIIDKTTNRKINVRAEIKRADFSASSHRVLKIYDSDENKEIGHAIFMEATKENPCIISAEDYVGEDGAIYVEYMQNDRKGKYSHVGTLMHRILHELSKQEGHNGKMILDSMDKPAPFHYDSGFIPLASFNADNDYWKASSKSMELMIMKGCNSGSCCMCLDENKMQKLENGEHCIPDEIKNMDEEEFDELYYKYRDIMRNSSPFD